ncbi:uncharacterized protein MYCFIDRAFT_169218 [Pseudocercospora fijiensis CIRAD86]|uniref:Uncharacterized protein n=1 Tax=Pseudocercospora fijiensis (strain CIRAD86) TaxID=383855 RepID=N1Q913_PSEFD|nr:uncharacterized protein MYCFIDRAFT_169218 [Pseudocercospora fijiensis CIRAD86]EME87378.1 hypothetical protein MYCFIDRAFT_169218 [Pseudocercospora fijiensis CIRAD86]
MPRPACGSQLNSPVRRCAWDRFPEFELFSRWNWDFADKTGRGSGMSGFNVFYQLFLKPHVIHIPGLRGIPLLQSGCVTALPEPHSCTLRFSEMADGGDPC